ncbi:MAG: RDD family protein [Candidatus Hodarchaeales archaeon]|jgi:uncharacterized RDD family membrane protein YckC
MENNSREKYIDVYIEEIRKLLPYPSSLKTSLLKELRVDVDTAMEEAKNKNPSLVFGSPREVAKNFTKSQDWGTKRAGWWVRIFAYLVDVIILGLFLAVYIISGLIVILMIFLPDNSLTDLFQGSWGLDEPITLQLDLSLGETFLFLGMLFTLIGSAIFIFLAYLVALELYYSATIGKKVFKLSVVDISGIKITWHQALVRNLSKVLGGFLPVDLILGMMLERHDPDKHKKQRGLEILAETIVVKQDFRSSG